MVTGYEWLKGRGWEWVGQAYVFAFVQEVAPKIVLEKLTGSPSSAHQVPIGEVSGIPGEGNLLCAADMGGWTVLVEPFPVCMSDATELAALSAGTEVVAVTKEFSGAQSFARIVDEVSVISFDPILPSERSGRFPDMLDAEIARIGFTEDSPDGNELQCLQLADLITGTHVSPEDLARPQLWVRVAKPRPGSERSLQERDSDLAWFVGRASAPARSQAIAHFIRVRARQAELSANSQLQRAVAWIEAGLSFVPGDDPALEGALRAWEQAQARAMDEVAEARNPEEVRAVRQAYVQGVVAQAVRLAAEPSQPGAAHRVLADIDSASPDPEEASLRRNVISILVSDGRA